MLGDFDRAIDGSSAQDAEVGTGRKGEGWSNLTKPDYFFSCDTGLSARSPCRHEVVRNLGVIRDGDRAAESRELSALIPLPYGWLKCHHVEDPFFPSMR